MSISAIGSSQTSATQQLQGPPHQGPGRMAKAGMDAAATALNMSASDLKSALTGGQSLTDLATSKGVSIDSLTSTMSAALTKENPSLSSDRAQQIAQRMIAGPEQGANPEGPSSSSSSQKTWML